MLETMTPLEFLSFRDRLESGSGFQSFQFREFEFALGHKQPAALERYPAGSAHRARLERRLAAPTLWDGFLRYLAAGRRGDPRRGAAARRDAADRAVGRGAGGAGGGLSRRRDGGAGVRAAGGSRRGGAGVALPPREDGAAHHRHEARHGRFGRRGVPAAHAEPAGLSRSRGRFEPSSRRRSPCAARRAPTGVPNRLAPHYTPSAWRSASS